MRKSINKKLRTGLSAYREAGLLGLGIKSLEYLQKTTRKHGALSRKHAIDVGALYDDVLNVDFSKPANEAWKGAKSKKSFTFNWLMPPPGKGSGGHMTIFRFIKYLEDTGHECRIYFHRPGPGSTVEGVVEAMAGSFPSVKASMEWLQPGQEMSAADGIFATSWETAYTVHRSKVNAKKFYFVQDYEPFFYPISGQSILAENTYRLGLRGITAGGWLEKKLHDEFDMVTSSFDFGSDSTTYTYENKSPRKEVTFYARPTTARRAFELGVVILDIFHRRHPDYVINFIGWDVSEYAIPFPYNNLGILTPAELNEVYNRSAASLVMSLTNMSLLPLELLSSGCIPVVNEGDNNRLVSNNPYIHYSPNNPSSMADALAEVVSRKDLVEHAEKASKSVRGATWDSAGKHFVDTVVKSVQSKGDQ